MAASLVEQLRADPKAIEKIHLDDLYAIQKNGLDPKLMASVKQALMQHPEENKELLHKMALSEPNNYEHLTSSAKVSIRIKEDLKSNDMDDLIRTTGPGKNLAGVSPELLATAATALEYEYKVTNYHKNDAVKEYDNAMANIGKTQAHMAIPTNELADAMKGFASHTVQHKHHHHNAHENHAPAPALVINDTHNHDKGGGRTA